MDSWWSSRWPYTRKLTSTWKLNLSLQFLFENEKSNYHFMKHKYAYDPPEARIEVPKIAHIWILKYWTSYLVQWNKMPRALKSGQKQAKSTKKDQPTNKNKILKLCLHVFIDLAWRLINVNFRFISSSSSLLISLFHRGSELLWEQFSWVLICE